MKLLNAIALRNPDLLRRFLREGRLTARLRAPNVVEVGEDPRPHVRGEVMKALAPFENVTVLYGHIHREHEQTLGTARHFAARGLAWAFNDPAEEEKKALPFDPGHPFAHLGLRVVHAAAGKRVRTAEVKPDGVELTMEERSGTEGFAQLLRPTTL